MCRLCIEKDTYILYARIIQFSRIPDTTELGIGQNAGSSLPGMLKDAVLDQLAPNSCYCVCKHSWTGLSQDRRDDVKF